MEKTKISENSEQKSDFKRQDILLLEEMVTEFYSDPTNVKKMKINLHSFLDKTS
jgi:hypothetical protein